MIVNRNYVNSEILNGELSRLFHSSWFYVGLIDDLKNDLDYITYKVGNVNLFVKNYGNVIKCFSNVCVHRFNSIHMETAGNGRSICSYHNWFYNERGEAQVSSDFVENLSHCNRQQLEEYQVDCCGAFIFVKINKEDHESLSDYLGSFHSKLVEVSSSFCRKVNLEEHSIVHRANWKLLVENVLECYHCLSVHKASLVPMGIGSKKPENHYFENGHDTIDYPARLTIKQIEKRNKLRFVDKTSYKHDSLRHFFIFPNLFITSTLGNLFYIGRLDPIKFDETHLKTNFVSPMYSGLTEREQLIRDAFEQASLMSSIKVINEDRVVLEELQKNLFTFENDYQIFGAQEFRITEFHEFINKKMRYNK